MEEMWLQVLHLRFIMTFLMAITIGFIYTTYGHTSSWSFILAPISNSHGSLTFSHGF